MANLQCKFKSNCSAQKIVQVCIIQESQVSRKQFPRPGGVSRKSRYLYDPVILYKQTTSCKDLLITKKIELIFFRLMNQFQNSEKWLELPCTSAKSENPIQTNCEHEVG